ncbi:MAG TPA: glycosyltransferase, partial [Actinomycetota bacterium]
MKVLVVSSYPPRHCGIGAYARDQVAGLRAAGQDVTVLSPPDGDGDLRARFLGGAAILRATTIGGRFDRLVVHFQPALYYRPRRPVSKTLTSLAFLALAWRRGRKLDVVVHEADPPSLWRPDYAILRLAFRLAGLVSFHTEAERAAFERDYRVDLKARVIPHRVLTTRAIPSRGEARDRLGIGRSEGPVFVCPGFLQPDKGFERAVEAFRSGHRNGASLYVVGSVRDHTPRNDRYARGLADLCRSVSGVSLVDRFATDEEFDLWVAAADWLVLPYRRSWSSGVLA